MGYLGKIGLTIVAIPFAAVIGSTIGAVRAAKDNQMTVNEVKDLVDLSTELAAKDAKFGERLHSAYERAMATTIQVLGGNKS